MVVAGYAYPRDRAAVAQENCLVYHLRMAAFSGQSFYKVAKTRDK
jgi:hypothetical protein